MISVCACSTADQSGRAFPDAPLRLAALLEPAVEGLVGAGQSSMGGTAVGSRDESPARELVEVAPGGHRRDAELGLEGGDRHAAALAQLLGDHPPALGRQDRTTGAGHGDCIPHARFKRSNSTANRTSPRDAGVLLNFGMERHGGWAVRIAERRGAVAAGRGSVGPIPLAMPHLTTPTCTGRLIPACNDGGLAVHVADHGTPPPRTQPALPTSTAATAARWPRTCGRSTPPPTPTTPPSTSSASTSSGAAATR